MGGDSTVVALREGVDDGQSESSAARATRGIGAGESVEGVREEFGWESGSVIEDTNLDAVGGRPLDADADRRGTVLGGVVDEVADDPIQVVRVGANVLVCGAVDVELVAEAVEVALADPLQVGA